MASLIEDLISTLEKENDEYVKLVQLAKKMTPVIIKGDVVELNEMVAEEQGFADRLSALEKKREEVVTDIAIVLNKDADTLTVKHIIELLKGQDKVQKQLSDIHDRLRSTLGDMSAVDEINRQLIQESLELVNFNINYINGLNQLPEMANYNRGAYNEQTSLINSTFDAKN